MKFIRFLLRRLLFMLVTLVFITAMLYGIMMLAPVEARAILYMPRSDYGQGSQQLIQEIIEEKGLDDPYPVQYVRWAVNLLRGDWGWSPSMRDDVLPALIRRTPVTAELTLYSVLLYIPLGLASGVWAGWKRRRFADYGFRLVAFIATSIPPFILGLVLLAIFYVGLHWFPIGRLAMSNKMIVDSPEFRTITGLLTVDGLLNSRLDITLDALRHLVLPVFTLSLTHWATLGRVTRASMIEELDKEYVTAARGRGLSVQWTVWRHALSNALLPALNSSALSAASLITGVFVIEVIFALPGISELFSISAVDAFSLVPDISATMGFALYGVLFVLPLMFVLDVIQAIVDPRIREGGLK
ncbi:MAG: ABC transporter permease [Anaerolineae bacterium]|nr:ABC transporter permease [Anaerolineae bacterium]